MTVILRSTSKRESAHLYIVQNGVLSDIDKFDIPVSKKIQLPIYIYLSETSAIVNTFNTKSCDSSLHTIK